MTRNDNPGPSVRDTVDGWTAQGIRIGGTKTHTERQRDSERASQGGEDFHRAVLAGKVWRQNGSEPRWAPRWMGRRMREAVRTWVCSSAVMYPQARRSYRIVRQGTDAMRCAALRT